VIKMIIKTIHFCIAMLFVFTRSYLTSPKMRPLIHGPTKLWQEGKNMNTRTMAMSGTLGLDTGNFKFLCLGL